MILLNSFISRISPRSALRLYNGCRFQVRIFFQRYPILIIMPFYAVKRGRVPGVYESWAECQNQIDGYAGAKFKKFSTEEDAYAFAEIPMEKNSKDASCEVTKIFGELMSKFEGKVAELSSLSESLVSAISKLDKSEINLAFTEMVTNLDAGVNKLKTNTDLAVHSKFMETVGKRKSDVSGTDTQPEKKKKAVLEPRFTGDSFEDDEGIIVYTDGCCFHNGKHGASAGIGVYWGLDSKDNVGERLLGRQTNNRAEIHAVIKAVDQAIKKNLKNLIIHTDSMFLINCVTKWMAGWKKKGWLKSDGEEVANKEELQELDALMGNLNIKWVHVDAHCGIAGNEAADKLANQGAKLPLPE